MSTDRLNELLDKLCMIQNDLSRAAVSRNPDWEIIDKKRARRRELRAEIVALFEQAALADEPFWFGGGHHDRNS